MIITILGWLVVVAIGSLMVMWGISSIRYLWYIKICSIKRKGLEEFASRSRENRYWLNEEDRKPFQELYDFMIERIEYGHISGQSLRDKVDGIILKQRSK